MGRTNAQKSREMEPVSESQEVHVNQATSSNTGTVNQEKELSTTPSGEPNKHQRQHSTPSDPVVPVCTQAHSTVTSLEMGTPTSKARKKIKLFGIFPDQSTEQLDDVTAVSEVDMKEEKDLLRLWRKDEGRALEEGEERLILQRSSLKRKLAQISNMDEDNGLDDSKTAMVFGDLPARMRNPCNLAAPEVPQGVFNDASNVQWQQDGQAPHPSLSPFLLLHSFPTTRPQPHVPRDPPVGGFETYINAKGFGQFAQAPAPRPAVEDASSAVHGGGVATVDDTTSDSSTGHQGSPPGRSEPT